MEKRKILYVEDDAIVLMAYRTRLLREGFQVEVARDGLEATKMLADFVPDLVLLDLMLPKLSGVEVLRFMQKTPQLKSVPVIVVSANLSSEEAQDEVVALASKRFLKTFFTFPDLLQAIREVLANHPTSLPASEPAASGTEAR